MMRPLGEIARISTGYPFRSKVESEAGGDLVVVQIKDIEEGHLAQDVGSVVLQSSGGRYERYLLRAGDLLLQARGHRHPVAVVAPQLHGIAAMGVLVIRPKREVMLPAYLACWLNLPVTQARLSEGTARGTYVPFISKRDLAPFEVPVPPLAVQEQLAELDRLRREEARLQTELTQLKTHWIEGRIARAATAPA